MLSPKENYMKCMRGETPEYIPYHSMGCGSHLDLGGQPTNFRYAPSLVAPHHVNNRGGLDMWGVEYVTTPEAMGGLTPRIGNFLLDDIRRWRDVIKAPDISNVDWERLIKDDFKNAGIDFEHKQTAVSFSTDMSCFIQLMAMMGFTEGLLAMHEEPDEVMALFEYMTNFYCKVSECSIDIVKPDIWHMADDTCAQAAPMISESMYRRMLIPFYKKQMKIALDRGIPVTFHLCGKCENFIDILTEIGVTAWESAGSMNNLAGIKAKYGNKLVIIGGWGSSSLTGDVSYDAIYQHTKERFDMLAPGGGFAFVGSFATDLDPELSEKKSKWLNSIYEGLKYTYYV